MNTRRLNLSPELLEHASDVHKERTTWCVTSSDNTQLKRRIGSKSAIGEDALRDWLGQFIETWGYPVLVQRRTRNTKRNSRLLLDVVLEPPTTETNQQHLKPGQDLELFQLLHEKIDALEGQRTWAVMSVILYFIIHELGWFT